MVPKRPSAANSQNQTKYIFRRLSIVISMLLAISICGYLTLSENTTTTLYAADSLIVALDADIRTFDPRQAVDANSQYIENLIYCPLIGFDPNGQPKGMLAKSWKWNTSTILEVEIDQEMLFSSGNHVLPEDVKATYDSLMSDKTKPISPRKAAFSNVKEIKIINPKHTLQFHLSQPDATFITNLVVGILPSSVTSRAVTEENPAPSCGPYVLASANISEIILTANPQYKKADRPKIEKLIFKVVKDESTRLAKLRAGEVDIVQNSIARDKIADISKKYPNIKIEKRAGLNTTYLGFNMRAPHVKEQLVRQAISHGIDRDKIIKYLLQGLATPAATLLTPNDPYLNAKIKVDSYNAELAKKLLDQAGFKDPDGDGPKTRFSLSLKTTTDLTRVSIARAIAADLKKIGIAVKVEPLEWGRFKADVDAGKMQMWTLSWIGFKDPDIFRYAFATESFPPNGGNRGWYSNKTLDALLLKGKGEPNIEERKKIYHQVQQLVDNEKPYVFLWHEQIFAVLGKNINNYKLYADGRLNALTNVVKK